MPEVTVHIEHITVPVSLGRTYTLRRTFENRDPYDTTFILKWFDKHHAELCGVDKLFTKEETRAIKHALIAHGVTLLDKYRNGKLLQRHYPPGKQTLPTHPLLLE